MTGLRIRLLHCLRMTWLHRGSPVGGELVAMEYWFQLDNQYRPGVLGGSAYSTGSRRWCSFGSDLSRFGRKVGYELDFWSVRCRRRTALGICQPIFETVSYRVVRIEH